MPELLQTTLKGKANPAQFWIGCEVPRRLKLPDFNTIGTLLLLLLLTAIGLSLNDSSPYTSTDKKIYIYIPERYKKHSTHSSKHNKYKYTLPKHPHIHTHT
jgi:hypothetical protein